MKTDLFGSPVALDDAAAREAWNATCLAFLAHGRTTPEHLGRLLTAAPDFALGHILRGLFCMLLGRREMVATAREAAAIARPLAEGCDRRTREMLAALDAMLARDPRAAVAALERILMADPGDTLAMKLSHGIRFLIGDAAGMRRSVERVLGAHGAGHPGRGYAMGCHAFALEETGDFALAERTGLAGLSHAADDAWGLHAVAHVHDMTARAEDGIRLIDGNRAAWEGSNNFRYHVWWHKALLHLDRGETDLALDLYDRQIRVDRTDDYRDIANATSLLARLELEGVATGNRWEELAQYAENRVEDGCLVFADLHYMLALIGGDRTQAQARLTARLAAQAEGPAPLDRVADHPGQAMAAGLTAFGEGRWAEAFTRLSSGAAALPAIGGSHAQRDVFERLTIEAGLRAGQFNRSEAAIRDRIERRGGHLDNFAATRLDRLDSLRKTAQSVPAE